MEHDFTNNPIKLRVIDFKTRELKKLYIFLSPPKDIEKELKKIEDIYNKHNTIHNSAKLKKFFGSKWQERLGLEKKVKGGIEFEIDDDIAGLIDMPVMESSDITLDIDEIDEEPEKEEVKDTTTSKGKIKFVFNRPVFPGDSVFEFKEKIYLLTGIPLYRQHLWFKYKGKSYPAQYNVKLAQNNINVDLLKQTANQEEIIEGIPVDLKYYKNKEFMHVTALDTFTLLHTNYEKYGVTEYNLIDANDIIDSTHIYNKLHTDKYQLEVIYYGFVLLYFPMMTYAVFMDYLKNENLLHEMYPDLHPDKAVLTRKMELNDKISSEAYSIDSKAYKELNKHLSASITSTIISITNYNQDIDTLLILRNVFDTLELNEYLTYCKANLLHENQNIILKKSYMMEREPRDTIPINSLLIKIKTSPETNEFMKLILFKNGNYIVKTNWREENHMSFPRITKDVALKINPIIKLINSMGNKVKHYEMHLPLLSKDNIQFTETSFVFYYDEDITEARFKVMKQILIEYEQAGIISSKDNVVMGQEYFFAKGMYKYEPSRIEKAITTENYYDYLSNALVKQKWATLFQRTRLFQILNVSSKLKMTISGVRNDTEIHFFHLYLTTLLHLYKQSSGHIKRLTSETIASKKTKTLKNLKVQDPILYDAKKIYKSKVVYSKICQKPYQPLMLSEEEYKNLAKDKKEKAVKYWNFTKEKPVWYSCPNPKFPYIKFIVKQHPKDFCIPCCKKIPMGENVNIKKRKIHEECLKTHMYKGKKVSLTKGSHYIATYGKDIEVGRLSRLPEHTLEPLFFDTYSPEGGAIDPECITADGYYLFGIDQNTANINNLGFIYCIIHALNLSLDDFIAECIKRLKAQPIKYRILLNGDINKYFDSVEELCKAIALVNSQTLIPVKYEKLEWNNLFMSIGYYFFGVNTVLFQDMKRERINLALPMGLKSAKEMFPSSHKNLVVLQKSHHYYPIYLLNTEVFKKTGLIETRLFLNESGLASTIYSIVKKYFDTIQNEKIVSKIDLSVIKQFTADAKIKIQGYFINNTNLCYAVLLDGCYYPIYPSHYSLEDDIDLIFAPYSKKYEVSYQKLKKLNDKYNKWVSAKSKKADLGIDVFPRIEPEAWLSVKGKKDAIGFLCNGMNFYIKGMKPQGKIPVHKLLYDPIKINSIIDKLKSQKVRKFNVKLKEKLNRATYNYYLYEMIMLQIITIFNRQRNKPLRKKIKTTLAKTNFDKQMGKLREFLTDTIEDVEDRNKLKKIIGRFLTTHHNKKTLVADIDNALFSFDKVEFEKMKKLPYEQVVKKLTTLIKTYITYGEVKGKNFDFPNILQPCEQNPKLGYCKGKKFVVSKKQLENIISIIAYDITNESKWKWLFNSEFIDKSVDFFKFIRRPKETITVQFL